MGGAHVRAVRFPSVALCLVLGLLTTVALAWAAALLVPLAPLSQQVRVQLMPNGGRSFGGRGGGWFSLPPPSGVVALDGDHLQPWLLRVERLGATRVIWFEKGRIYNRTTIGPPGGSSAAVSSWSLATDTRDDPNFRRGDVRLPSNLRRRIEGIPQDVWGVMEDQRGWPMRALKWQAVAPRYETNERAGHEDADVYKSRWAIEFPPMDQQRGGLAELRALPLMPVWSGLIIDTALFAGVWWIVLVSPRLVRASLRRRCGRCPACAYDLRGDLPGGCPECGWGRRAGEAARPEGASVAAE